MTKGHYLIRLYCNIVYDELSFSYSIGLILNSATSPRQKMSPYPHIHVIHTYNNINTKPCYLTHKDQTSGRQTSGYFYNDHEKLKPPIDIELFIIPPSVNSIESSKRSIDLIFNKQQEKRRQISVETQRNNSRKYRQKAVFFADEWAILLIYGR